MIITIIIIGLFYLLKFSRLSFSSSPSGELTMIFGLILIVAYFLGKFGAKFKIPMITGYLLTGILIGPFFLKLITVQNIKSLDLINEIALSIIAFSAGGEIDYHSIKKKIKSILTIVNLQVLSTFIITIGVFYFLLRFFILPSLVQSNMISPLSLAFSILLGTIATANSPSTTIAIIMETKSKGHMTDLVLAITILKDVIIIILFTVSLSFSVKIASGGEGLNLAVFFHLILEILIAIGIGIGISFLIALYYRYVKKQGILFILILSFIITGFYYQFHFHFLLTCMVAGLLTTNLFSDIREKFLTSLKEISLPIFILFFTITGADLNMITLKKYWVYALIYVLIRGGSIFIGTYFGALINKEGNKIKYLSWVGFLGQAGLTIGFLNIIETKFPAGGTIIKDIALGGIILNQIFGPIAFKWALIKGKEAMVKQDIPTL